MSKPLPLSEAICSCSSSVNKAEICLWREEECIKVLFHECIHGLKFSSIQDSDKIDEAFSMIIDHKALNQRASDYWRNIDKNILFSFLTLFFLGIFFSFSSTSIMS